MSRIELAASGLEVCLQTDLLVFWKEDILQRILQLSVVVVEAHPQRGLLVFWKECFQQERDLDLSFVVVVHFPFQAFVEE